MLSEFRIIGVIAVIWLVTACTSQGGSYAVGPQSSSQEVKHQVKKVAQRKPLRVGVLIPVMDPNIPDNADDYEKLGVWPELRRAEANRFSIKLRDALEDTKAFNGVRVSPDASATSELYVLGKIVESNGEDIKLGIKVVDISGKRHLSKIYSHRVKQYAVNDPRNPNADLYDPVFKKIAKDIARKVKKLRPSNVIRLQEIDDIRFGQHFSEEYFSSFLKTSNGRTKLRSAPAVNDPMVERLKPLRVRDQLFMDNMQTDYNHFTASMNDHYIKWQRQAFVESKSARKAKTAAALKSVLGGIALVAGVAAMSKNSYESGSYDAGLVTAIAGVAAISSAAQDAASAVSHKESLNELGRSINIEISPKVIELEDKTIELKGDVSQQYKLWRKFLKEFYQEELTPDIAL